MPSSQERQSLTLGVKLSYALPRLACSLFSQHIAGKARKYYTDGEPGISPATLAMLVAVLKCFDLFIGMMVGYYSDNCRSKYGRRKPFIAAGAPLWCTAVFMLCLAPSGLSAQAYIWYFGFFYFLYYSVGWSMTVITYDALAMELTTDYDERSSLFGYKGMSQMIGYILYFAAAGVFAGTYPNDVQKQVFIPGILFCVAVLLAFGQMLVVVDEPPQSEAQIKASQEDDDGVVPMVRRMLRNPVYQRYLWFKAPGSMAFEIPGSILAYYIQYAVFDTNPNLSQTLAGAMTVGGSILAIPVVVRLCKRLDKHIVLFGFLLVYGAVLTLAAFIPPSLPMVYILGSVIGIGMGAWFVIPDALLGDCIDYDELHTGVRSESGYTVIETNLQQFMEVPAYAIPFTTVGLLGYLSNGGCGCGCGYGKQGCVYAPLTLTQNVTNEFNVSVLVEETAWQSALVIGEDDEGYVGAISCGDADVYSRLNLVDSDLCKPYDAFDENGKSLVSFEETCNAVFTDGPCSMNGLLFSGDDSTFGENICAYTAGEIGGPEAYCTYQPPAVRIGFIVFQCLLPGVCGLLAAWGAYSFPLARTSQAEVVAGIAAHKDGDGDVQDPLTKVQVPVPNVDAAWKAAQAAYDHYSDSELHAALRMSDKPGALALLKGRVTKLLGLEVGVLIFMLVLVLVAAAEDTTEEMLWLSAAVAVASLVSAVVLFLLGFDFIRWRHLGSIMSNAAYLEPEQLAAQIVAIQTRTMRDLNASGTVRVESQTELNPAPTANVVDDVATD